MSKESITRWNTNQGTFALFNFTPLQLEGSIGHDCSGAIIEKEWVLSTAQCIQIDDDVYGDTFIAVMGDHNVHEKEESEQVSAFFKFSNL